MDSLCLVIHGFGQLLKIHKQYPTNDFQTARWSFKHTIQNTLASFLSSVILNRLWFHLLFHCNSLRTIKICFEALPFLTVWDLIELPVVFCAILFRYLKSYPSFYLSLLAVINISLPPLPRKPCHGLQPCLPHLQTN